MLPLTVLPFGRRGDSDRTRRAPVLYADADAVRSDLLTASVICLHQKRVTSVADGGRVPGEVVWRRGLLVVAVDVQIFPTRPPS